MMIRKELLIILLIMFFLPLSCTRLDQATPTGTTSLAMEELPADGSIPAHYGDLVSVISLDEYPNMAHLWFQDGEGTIRMVQYSLRFNHFNKFSYLVLRK